MTFLPAYFPSRAQSWPATVSSLFASLFLCRRASLSHARNYPVRPPFFFSSRLLYFVLSAYRRPVSFCPFPLAIYHLFLCSGSLYWSTRRAQGTYRRGSDANANRGKFRRKGQRGLKGPRSFPMTRDAELAFATDFAAL